MITRHFAVIRGEDHDRLFPEAELVEAVFELLQAEVRVTNHVQVVVVEDLPHIRAVGGNGAENPLPPGVVFAQRRWHARRRQRFQQRRRGSGVPALVVQRILRWGDDRFLRDGLLHLRCSWDIGVGVHDVVRVQVAHHQEEGLPGFAQRGHIATQPSDTVACRGHIRVVALVGRAGFVAVRLIDVESIRLERFAVVDRRLGRNDVCFHFPLAEECGLVAELLHHRAHVGLVSGQVGHPAGLHLVEDSVDLRRTSAVERRTGRRAHRRRDVVVAEANPLLRQTIQGRCAVTGRSGQVEPRLITDDQDDVQRLVRRPARAGRSRHRVAARVLAGALLPLGDTGTVPV